MITWYELLLKFWWHAFFQLIINNKYTQRVPHKKMHVAGKSHLKFTLKALIMTIELSVESSASTRLAEKSHRKVTVDDGAIWSEPWMMKQTMWSEPWIGHTQPISGNGIWIQIIPSYKIS